MNSIVIDFETYFDKTYTLKKLNSILYIRDNRFHVFGAGVAISGGPAMWVTDMASLKQTILDLRPVTIIGHNLLFDGLILVERLGIPREGVTWLDTLSLARASVVAKSYSLDALSQGSAAVKQTMPDVIGLRELDTEKMAALAEYCLADVNATKVLYEDLIRGFPATELELIDLVIDMGVRACLELDKPMLEQAMKEAVEYREKVIADCGVDRKVLASNQQFARHLESLGVTPPVKVSITTGKLATAFSKSDLEYVQFQERNPQLADLFAAREAVKSTLPITRTQAFLDIKEAGSGLLPIPLNYGATITGRLSGNTFNMQNLPRGSALRKAITAPKGWVLVVGDLGQIEARMLAMLAGEESLLEVFRAGKDLYVEYAKQFYGVEEVTKNMRNFSKLQMLACGYGMGAVKFRDNCLKGAFGLPPVPISPGEAVQAVKKYRELNKNITAFWGFCDDLIEDMIHFGPDDSLQFEPFTAYKDKIKLPNGLFLKYPGLRHGETGVVYGLENGEKEYLYGGKLVNNLVQGASRVLMTDAWRTISKQFRVVLSVHDELVLLAREDEAETAAAELCRVMTTPPSWLPGIPLTADIGYAKNYLK